MIIDGRTVEHNTTITSDLCIVGAGPAGLTLALELENSFDRIVVLESGAETLDARTQQLYAGDNIGIDYGSLEVVRSRFLGGSSNCWGGWCRPLDPIDFEQRAWIPNSGWPLDRATLDPFYRRAHTYLGLGPYDYAEAAWQDELTKRRQTTLKLDGKQFHNQLVQLSPPTRFGTAYRSELKNSATITVLTWSNACEVQTRGLPTQVSGVKVCTLEGKCFFVSSRRFILAAGGIENARLLLYSHDICDNAMGDGYELFGRYFMDHPKVRSTTFRFKNQGMHRMLYDSTVAGTHHWSGKNPNAIAAHIAPTSAFQRTAELPNSRSYLVGRYAYEESSSFRAVMTARARMLEERRYGKQTAPEFSYPGLAKTFIESPRGLLGLIDKTISPSRKSRKFTLETVIETIPNPDSKVILIKDCDEIGVNKVSLDWRISEHDRKNIKITTNSIASHLVEQDIAAITDDDDESEAFVGCWHHMGTTRMSDSPKTGVVDKNLQVFGVQNLYCLGSSVFPTAGSDCPTITIVALAIRMADAFKASPA